ncbi:MAG: crossover junction endodeoxyribonuclease RuvC [Candidatus Omnitrophota bacterium]
MRILGIDPALAITGYGVIDVESGALSLVDAGIVRTNARNPLSERLAVIYKGISRVVNDLRPDCMVLEKIYVHYRHPTTAYILGQARGIICLISAQHNLTLFEYTPTRIKKGIVGGGLASKTQIQKMVANLLALRQLPKHQDITDALALAIAHSHIGRINRIMNC